jgi:hypothetical protein
MLSDLSDVKCKEKGDCLVPEGLTNSIFRPFNDPWEVIYLLIRYIVRVPFVRVNN